MPKLTNKSNKQINKLTNKQFKMKQLSIIAVLFLSVVLFSCNSGGDKSNGEDKKGTDSFEAFWGDFQSAVAADDKDSILALCNEDVKSFIEGSYDFTFDEKMKSEIAKAKPSDIEVLSEDERLFQYIIEYPNEGEETFSSSFGFVIGKVNGKWMLTVPSFAG